MLFVVHFFKTDSQKEIQMSEDPGPFRRKETTLDDVLDEVQVIRKTLDYEIPAIKANTSAQNRRPNWSSLKDWMHRNNDKIQFYHYGVRYVILVLGFLFYSLYLANQGCNADLEERRNRFVETCTTACHSTGSEYTVYHYNGSSLISCTCARQYDGSTFNIDGTGAEVETAPVPRSE